MVDRDITIYKEDREEEDNASSVPESSPYLLLLITAQSEKVVIVLSNNALHLSSVQRRVHSWGKHSGQRRLEVWLRCLSE